MEKINADADCASAHLQVYLSFKRGLNIILSAIAFAILLIPMILIGILIKIDSPGPVLFKQERLGKDGKPFMIYKFRSMVEDAEKDGPKWADKDDGRCTRVGMFLRKSRLDELSQLLNILKGDMSLVGPRPEREYFYKNFGDLNFSGEASKMK
ncbi:MAG: sugar transferase [Erysipelotrichaceae bacterium]|nr:sugar transferase [Erysipelotrichaceae bacterium]